MQKTRNEGERKSDVDRTVKLTWKEVSDADLRAALAGAKDGSDPAASMKLIEYFYRRIHDNLPYDQTILFEYLDHVFGRIVEGERRTHVGLEGGRGVKRQDRYRSTGGPGMDEILKRQDRAGGRRHRGDAHAHRRHARNRAACGCSRPKAARGDSTGGRKSVDAFLLDIRMPDMNGIELCRTIRGIERYESAPIMFVSAMDQRDVLQWAIDAGCDDFMQKPIDAMVLRKRLGNLLQKAAYLKQVELMGLSLQRYVSPRTEEMARVYATTRPAPAAQAAGSMRAVLGYARLHAK